MSTAPFLARAELETRKGYTPVVRARVGTAAAYPGTTTALELVTANVSEDETWTPRITAELTVPASAFVAAMDPRTGWMLELDTGYVYLDGTEDVRTTHRYLIVRRVEPIAGTGTVRISAASADSLLEDVRFYEGIEFQTGRTIVEWLTMPTPDNRADPRALLRAVTPAGSAIRALWDTAAGRNLTAAGSLVWTAAVSGSTVHSYGEALRAALEVYGLRYYCTRDGVFTIAALTTTTSTPDYELETGPDGNVTMLNDSTSLEDDYASEVIVQYPGATGNARAPGLGPIVSLHVDRSTFVIPTQPPRDAAAAAILAQRVTYGRSLEAEGAAAYWLRAGATVRVSPHGQPSVDRIVRGVSFRFPGGTMTTTTRNPAAP